MAFKLTCAASVVSSLLLLGAPSWAGSNGGVKVQAAENPVVARVNGVEIFRSDLVDAQRILPVRFRTVPLARIFPRLLRQAINTTLVAEAARTQGLDKSDPVKRRVAAAEMSVLASAYLEYSAAKRMTDEVLRERYDTFAKTARGEEKIRIRHILLETEDDAIAVIKQLAAGGADFETLAREKSKAPDAVKGGDLGFVSRSVMVKRFSEAAFALDVGQITAKPVKTKLGWQVIKVEDKRMSSMPSFEKSRASLSALLSRRMTARIVDDLVRGAKIERFDINGMSEAPPAISATTDGNRPAPE